MGFKKYLNVTNYNALKSHALEPNKDKFAS